MDLFTDTVYWGIFISVGSYIVCDNIQRKKKLFFLNPLLSATVLTIIFLFVFNVKYEEYFEKTNLLYYLLSPATVCLAVPLYEQISVLRKNIRAIIGGIVAGVFAGMTSILLFSMLFGFSHIIYITLLPKSVTAAIAMGISEEMGGIPSLTVPIVIMTGITGHIISDKICRIFKIDEPVAKGIAIGTASHAMGTTKAMEMGEIEGAMSSLSIAVAGIITVIAVNIFSFFY